MNRAFSSIILALVSSVAWRTKHGSSLMHIAIEVGSMFAEIHILFNLLPLYLSRISRFRNNVQRIKESGITLLSNCEWTTERRRIFPCGVTVMTCVNLSWETTFHAFNAAFFFPVIMTNDHDPTISNSTGISLASVTQTAAKLPLCGNTFS